MYQRIVSFMNKNLEMPVLYSCIYKKVYLEALFIIQSHLVAKESKNIVQEMNKHIKICLLSKSAAELS